MNNNFLKFVLIICSVILGISIILFTVIRIKSDSSELVTNLEQVDINLNSGFYNQAEDLLAAAFSETGSSKDSFMFLKRAERLASATGDYSKFADYSERLLSRNKRNIEIAAIASYAQQKNNNYKRALAISGQKLGSSDYSEIHLLNLLENDIEPDDLKMQKRLGDKYGFIFNEGDYTVDIIQKAAEGLSDERLLIDASILLMGEGKKNEAYENMLPTDDGSFALIKSFIAYDNEKFDVAEKFFDFTEGKYSDDSVFLFGCDILMHNNKYNLASAEYEDFLKEHPDEYSLPYRNLYSIHRDSPERIKWLNEGLRYFQSDDDLIVSSAWEYYLNNNYNQLNEMLMNLDEQNKSVAGELFRVNMMLAGRSPEHVAGNFWNVFNMDPSSEVTAVSFANFLLENKQFEQLDLLLNKYSDINGYSDWIYAYSAIKNALQGDYSAAEEEMQKAADYNGNSVNLYNLGVVQILLKKYSAAVDSLEKALIQTESPENIVNNPAKIYLKLSETNYNIKDFKRAYYFINRAIELNPDSTRSRLLQAKIKEEYDD